MPPPERDYYALLGVLRDASSDEIKRAYYDAAQKLHPDKNKSAGETEIFLAVQQAYEVLSNPQRREQYNATLKQEDISPGPYRYRAEFSRPNLVHLNEPQLIYVLLDVGPSPTTEKIASAPLNVCLVIDRSTSMQGAKIEMARAAAGQIMRALRPEDIFSLVAFSDKAEVLAPAAYQSDPTKLQSRLQMIQTGGSTEIYQGLEIGLLEVRRNLNPQRVNHLILLTDGHTYGDEQPCLQLADEAGKANIGISGFGIGGDWNDIFLDALTSRTGSNSSYISRPEDIQRALEQKFKALNNTMAEDVILELKPAEGIQVNYAFRLQPEGGPITVQDELHLGPILQETSLKVLFEIVILPSASQADTITLMEGNLKLVVSARPTPIPPLRLNLQRTADSVSQNVAPDPALLHALSRYTSYRMQERARQEADSHDYDSATRHLKNLASRLVIQGERELAATAILEAQNMEKLQAFSKEGSKVIKYGTRALLLAPVEKSR